MHAQELLDSVIHCARRRAGPHTNEGRRSSFWRPITTPNTWHALGTHRETSCSTDVVANNAASAQQLGATKPRARAPNLSATQLGLWVPCPGADVDLVRDVLIDKRSQRGRERMTRSRRNRQIVGDPRLHNQFCTELPRRTRVRPDPLDQCLGLRAHLDRVCP